MINYTGPLTTAAHVGDIGKTFTHADYSIILIGMATDCGPVEGSKFRRVRMEMTLDDAEDLVWSLRTHLKTAKK